MSVFHGRNSQMVKNVNPLSRYCIVRSGRILSFAAFTAGFGADLF